MLVLLIALLLAGRAHGEELGPSPWFPLVDPEKGAGETLALNSLCFIRVGGGQWRVCRGKYRESVTRHNFFVTVGRPDLDARESHRRALESGFEYGGYGAGLTGIALLFAKAVKGGFDPPWVVGGGLLASGVASVWVSRAFAGPDLSQDDAEGLVIRYNERLRGRLEGEDPALPTVARASPGAPRRWLVPWLSAQGGGLVAVGSF